MLVFRVVSFASQTSLTFEISIGFLKNSHRLTMFCQGLGVIHQTFQSRFPNDNRNGPKVNVRILFGISMSGLWLKIIGTAIWVYQEYRIGLEFRRVSVFTYIYIFIVDTIWWYSYTHICTNTYLLIYIMYSNLSYSYRYCPFSVARFFFQPALPFGYVGSCRSTGGNSKQTLRPVSVRFVENHPCGSNMYSYTSGISWANVPGTWSLKIGVWFIEYQWHLDPT